jgi:hypothetical protein
VNLKYLAPCVCRQVPCSCAEWETRLRSEGLAHLDYIDRDGCITPGNKGSGKAKNAEVEANRELKAAYRDWCLSVLTSFHFTDSERQIWERHAYGQGNLSIAKQLGVTEWNVRTTISRIKASSKAPTKATPIKHIICRTDPVILALILKGLSG